MADGKKNFVIVDVSTGYNDSATSIVLSTGHGARLPDPASANFNLVWWNATDYANPANDPEVEIVRVTGLSTDTLTVVRPAVGNAYNGETSANTAQNHNTGGKTYKMILAPTYKTFADIDTALAGKAPSGFLINGKIVPSVASSNLTVAIKGLDGNDPSATNPVYVRIGDTVHTITSALSVTKNAGTNWLNAGSAELATKEIDYFVYLGYNATDGVVIGFSRIPSGTEYDSFSATTTNEKYCAISTTTNAAAGDDYVNIGRFAATLSAGAGYTWTVPTFTNKNLIQRPVFETRILQWQPVYTGFTASVPTGTGAYQILMGRAYFQISPAGGGTSNANSYTMTMPFANTSVLSGAFFTAGRSYNNSGTEGVGMAYMASVSTLTCFPAALNSTWVTSNVKSWNGSFSYEI